MFWFKKKKKEQKPLAKVGMQGQPVYTPDSPPSPEHRRLRNYIRLQKCIRNMDKLRVEGKQNSKRFKEFELEYKERMLFLEKEKLKEEN